LLQMYTCLWRYPCPILLLRMIPSSLLNWKDWSWPYCWQQQTEIVYAVGNLWYLPISGYDVWDKTRRWTRETVLEAGANGSQIYKYWRLILCLLQANGLCHEPNTDVTHAVHMSHFQTCAWYSMIVNSHGR
jgi:hypothetical protein